MIKKVDHIAIVVKDLDTAIKSYGDMFGFKVESKMEFPGGDRIAANIKLGDIVLELFQPIKEGTDLDKFLKETGGGLYHMALATDDIGGEIKHIKSKGKKMIHEEPIVIPNAKIAFIHPSAGENVSIELVERG